MPLFSKSVKLMRIDFPPKIPTRNKFPFSAKQEIFSGFFFLYENSQLDGFAQESGHLGRSAAVGRLRSFPERPGSG